MVPNNPTSHCYWRSQPVLNLRCPEVSFNFYNASGDGFLLHKAGGCLGDAVATGIRDLGPCVSVATFRGGSCSRNFSFLIGFSLHYPPRVNHIDRVTAACR
jgi:hypothetical protein